jgi:Arc/MetJ family transcription regulator
VYERDDVYTFPVRDELRTNIDIDDELLAQAMKVTGEKTKKGTIEAALRAIVRDEELRQAILDMSGMGWEGDLDEMRRGWGPPGPL